MTSRPRTSNPRGFCKYYTSSRGCYAGERCKFLHTQPLAEASKVAALQHTELTPYDQSKRCVYYSRGFCRRGDSCWFKHESPIPVQSAQESEKEPCSICLEDPVTYGLLLGCNHVFCITCIRQWRASKQDVSWSGVNKCCPLCRAPSFCVIPSSHFKTLDARSDITSAYRMSCERIPCKYFEESKQRGTGYLWCPFGRDCFYGHRKEDGTRHAFEQGVRGRRGLIPRPRNANSADSSRHSNSFNNTVTVISRLFSAPLDVLQRAADVASSGLTAVLDALSIEWHAESSTFSRNNVVDVVEATIFSELAAFTRLADAEEREGSEMDRVYADMNSRMIHILRLMEGLSESAVDEVAPPPNRPAPSEQPPSPEEEDDDMPSLLPVESSSDEEEWESEEEADDDDDESITDTVEAWESSSAGYFLWTGQEQPSAMRRRNSDTATPPVGSLRPFDRAYTRVAEDERTSSEPSTPRVAPRTTQSSTERELDRPTPCSPPPPPPGPFVTDGRGRPIVWSVGTQTTTDASTSSTERK